MDYSFSSDSTFRPFVRPSHTYLDTLPHDLDFMLGEYLLDSQCRSATLDDVLVIAFDHTHPLRARLTDIFQKSFSILDFYFIHSSLSCIHTEPFLKKNKNRWRTWKSINKGQIDWEFKRLFFTLSSPKIALKIRIEHLSRLQFAILSEKPQFESYKPNISSCDGEVEYGSRSISCRDIVDLLQKDPYPTIAQLQCPYEWVAQSVHTAVFRAILNNDRFLQDPLNKLECLYHLFGGKEQFDSIPVVPSYELVEARTKSLICSYWGWPNYLLLADNIPLGISRGKDTREKLFIMIYKPDVSADIYVLLEEKAGEWNLYIPTKNDLSRHPVYPFFKKDKLNANYAAQLYKLIHGIAYSASSHSKINEDIKIFD